ncbi:DUF4192 family protein [Microbacterium sp. X-17]|uniref:DUF4192 family protein n=1 Tax=Microbacterium sp. X-17 TaxID=3144404 RepID=UPI0031F55E2B
MTSTIKAAGPAHFLALIPGLLGFVPRRSVVLMPFDGRSSLGAMRLDLPSAALADETERIASDFIGLICRIPDADGFAMVTYTDAALRSVGEDALPYHALADALLDRADACGLRVVDLLCVARDGWGSYYDPGDAHPLDEVAGLAKDAGLPPAAGDQTTGTRLPRVAAAEREQVAHALGSIRAASLALLHGEVPGHPPRARVDPLAIAALEVLDDLPGFLERCLGEDPRRLDAYVAATLSWCLSQPGLRDVALLGWTDGRATGERALDAQLHWRGGAPYPPELGLRLWGEGPRPDPDRLRRALDLTRRVAALTPAADRAHALALCGWLSWALGRSTHAGIYVERALRLDPRHVLAEIVGSFVVAGHLPDWAFQPARRPTGQPSAPDTEGLT